MDKLMDMKKKLEFMVDCELSKAKEQIDAKELGEVVDMIKDLAEANYYCKITEAMENQDNQYGRDYGYRGRLGYMPYDSMNPDVMPITWNQRDRGQMTDKTGVNYTGQVGGNMGSRNSSNYRPGNTSGQGGNYGSSGNSKYGYSHDDYMKKMEMLNDDSPATRDKRKEVMSERLDEISDMLTDTMDKMSMEEKQLWKTKLNRIVNM